MENRHFLQPVELSENLLNPKSNSAIGHHILKNLAGSPFPDISNCKAALLGVEESRNSAEHSLIAGGPDFVRHFLYNLETGPFNLTIADLGNLIMGHKVEDTYAALSEIMVELLENNVIPIIIGGSHDLTYGCYKAYEKLRRIINITAVDKEFDLETNSNDKLHSGNYLKKIITQQPNFLFNYSNVGYQTYYVEQDAIKLMENMFFDTFRLGAVRAAMPEVEPIIRNTDLLSIDIGAIRASDAPGYSKVSPNGFFGDEVCQIARYAGLAENVSSIGIFEYNPHFDAHGITAQLIAQMIWYFLEGLYNRQHEDPAKDKNDFIKYYVPVNSTDEGIVFYRSKKTDRWWMEIGANINLKSEYRRHNLIPCSLKDYNTATENDIPDRWWKAFQKLM